MPWRAKRKKEPGVELCSLLSLYLFQYQYQIAKTMSTTMRGWVFRSRGPPAQVLKLETDLPRPTAESLAPHDVLIKVRYSAVFQGMALLMSMLPHFNNKPWIAEATYSGVVEAVGSQVDGLQAGDEVFGGLSPNIMLKYGGTLAEHIVLPDEVVVRKPANLSFEGAGGIAPNVVTAQQLIDVAKVKKGGRVLITGASSGTGTTVVQVARDAVGVDGLVVGTCSSKNEQLVKSLGVDEVSSSRAAHSSHCLLVDALVPHRIASNLP